MSSVAINAAPRRASRNGFPREAQACLLAVGVVTLAAVLSAFAQAQPSRDALVTFAILGVCASAAQFFVVPTGSNHGFHTAIAFVVAAALLLPPELVALMGLVQHLPHGLKQRYPWYIQAFNVCNYTLAGLAAWGSAHLVREDLLADPELRFALAGLVAAVAWIAVNHLLLAAMLLLARGHSFRESGLLSLKSISMDLVVATLGVALAAFWEVNPWLTPTVIAPLILSHHSFRVMALLRDSEHRFRAMFESAAFGTAVLDLEGKVVSSNRALDEMLGYSATEIVGRAVDQMTHEGDRDRELELFAKLVAGERDVYRLEKRCLASSGAVVWTRNTVSLVRDADDRPKFAIAMLEDITSRKRAEDDRVRLESQLRQAQKMEAVGQLAGGVAHDFNNLLTAIRGYSEFALNRLGRDDDGLRKDIEEISRSAERATALTRQLLAFSRKQILQPKVLDLNDVVSDIEKMLRRLIGENIEVATIFGSGLGRVQADPGQLEQVLVNLVVNARDAMPSGGKLTIETANLEVDDELAGRHEGLSAGRYVMLAVRDTGHGMDHSTKARLFEPFFTTKEQGKGTGLGLATVYGIVKQSGGYVLVESEPGRGAAFKILLHRLESDLEILASELGGARDGRSRGSETVMLVEDEDVVRKLVREILESNGYTVLEARDGVEALALGGSFGGPIHLLVTDVVMPRMSGRELAEQLLAIHPETRVLYMSGYTDGIIGHHGVLEPMTELLQKPFSVDVLAEKVRRVLDAPSGVAA
jgi:PAS domain S-box-containing protein